VRVAVIFLCILTTHIYAKSISYEQLVDLAMQNSLELELKRYDVIIESHAVQTTLSTYYPTLQLAYNGEYYKDLQDGVSQTQSVGDAIIGGGTLYKNSLSLNLNYTLYDFGKRAHEVAINKHEVALKQEQLCRQTEELEQEILQNYVQAYQEQLKYKHNSVILKLKNQEFEGLKRLYEAGEYSKLNLATKALEILNLQDSIQNSIQQFEEAILNLNKTVNTTLSTDINGLELTRFHPKKVLRFKAFEQTPQAKELDEKIAQIQSRLKINELSNYPSVSLYGNYYAYGSDEQSYESAYDDINSNSWKVGVSVRINLFEGFKYFSEKKRLYAQLQKAQTQKQLLKQEYRHKQAFTQLKIENLTKKRAIMETGSIKAKELQTMGKRLFVNGQLDNSGYIDQSVTAIEQSLKNLLTIAQSEYEAKSLEILNKDRVCNLH
jgi:outer membrane protein